MSQITADEYVTVTKAAALLGTSPMAVLELVEHNEVDSIVLVRVGSLNFGDAA